MSLLEELKALLDSLGIPSWVGEFPEKPPALYAVLVPIIDEYPVEGDGVPLDELQHVRIHVYSTGNYQTEKNKVSAAAIAADMCITGRHYAGFESDTKYHNYAIDVAKPYFLEE